MRGGRFATTTVAAYAALFVLGAVQGVIGSFQYSRIAPAGAILLCVAIGVTCLLAAWGMRSATGAFIPAAGWLIASFVLSMPSSNGSVIITNTAAGQWYLYGGTLTAALAVVVTLAARFGTQSR